jgi:hypothetical protein
MMWSCSHRVLSQTRASSSTANALEAFKALKRQVRSLLALLLLLSVQDSFVWQSPDSFASIIGSNSAATVQVGQKKRCSLNLNLPSSRCMPPLQCI